MKTIARIKDLTLNEQLGFALNQSTDADFLDRLASSVHPETRAAVALHPNVSAEVLELLTEDRDGPVSFLATAIRNGVMPI